jgi:hypothetical protein
MYLDAGLPHGVTTQKANIDRLPPRRDNLKSHTGVSSFQTYSLQCDILNAPICVHAYSVRVIGFG